MALFRVNVLMQMMTRNISQIVDSLCETKDAQQSPSAVVDLGDGFFFDLAAWDAITVVDSNDSDTTANTTSYSSDAACFENSIPRSTHANTTQPSSSGIAYKDDVASGLGFCDTDSHCKQANKRSRPETAKRRRCGAYTRTRMKFPASSEHQSVS